MKEVPELGEPFADGPMIVRRGSTVWLNVEMETELYAEKLFEALRYIIAEDVELEATSRLGTTVSLTMTLTKMWKKLEAEG